jgi:ABC-type amino acid transport system permease subunit
MLDTSLTWSDVLFMLKGAWVTISLTLFAVLGGTSLGLLFGLVRASGPWWAQQLAWCDSGRLSIHSAANSVRPD